MPPRPGPPPPFAGAPASAAPARAFLTPGGTREAKGPQFVEHLAPGRGVPVTRGERDVPGVDDLAGVPPELLPPKKRVVRYHPYAAAAAIQEMASHFRNNHGGGGGFLLGASEPPMPTGTGSGRGRRDAAAEEERGEDGLRAELLRLRISRPAVVLTKQLTPSDRSRDKARLVLPDRLVAPSPLPRMLTAAERGLVLGVGLPVPALDRLGRAYRMSLRRDPSARTYRVTGQWSLFVSRHGARAGDAVEVRAFRPPAWQALLDKHGEGGLGMALLHHRRGPSEVGSDSRQGYYWCSRERDAADALLLIAATSARPATVAGA
ncbi:unnamed protein product [Miscanthus lutarioriparius]|uniref:TF-B3 domain-containing protein n=1 Tax=Miscanthus lutarioriparius TaxID=422564 RepID=A0A811PKB5_9POAL|nr:unnamed protein product [Miscanthus lutarioriparius]